MQGGVLPTKNQNADTGARTRAPRAPWLRLLTESSGFEADTRGGIFFARPARAWYFVHSGYLMGASQCLAQRSVEDFSREKMEEFFAESAASKEPHP